MPVSLQELKSRRLVWNAQSTQRQSHTERDVASSYPEFDKAVGGWPQSGVVELQPERLGIGELRLILPALKALSVSAAASKLQAWLAPPADLMPQGLGDAFLYDSVFIRPHRQEQVLWVLDTLLSSAVCSAAVCWIDKITVVQAKRLQVAAKDSGTLAFVLRMPGGRVEESLPVSMRLKLKGDDHGVQVHVFKRQNAFPVEPFRIPLNHVFPQLYQSSSGKDVHAYQHNVLSFPVRPDLM